MKYKTKNIIIFSVIAVMLISIITIGTFTIFAYNNDEIVTNDDLGLAEADAQYDRDEKKQNENDLLAYTILRRYGKTDATDLIQDKETDCILMKEICSMIRNDNLPEEEAEILKKYLERRTVGLIDPNTPKIDGQIELYAKIYDILGWEMYY